MKTTIITHGTEWITEGNRRDIRCPDCLCTGYDVIATKKIKTSNGIEHKVACSCRTCACKFWLSRVDEEKK